MKHKDPSTLFYTSAFHVFSASSSAETMSEQSSLGALVEELTWHEHTSAPHMHLHLTALFTDSNIDIC